MTAMLRLDPPQPHQLKSQIGFESGIWPRWHQHSSADTLGVASLMVATSLGIHRESDVVTSACLTIGDSPLRGAAWLRTRGAVVGHLASRRRLLAPNGDQYARAACRPFGPGAASTPFNYGEIVMNKIAEFLSPLRAVIVMVGEPWSRRTEGAAHAIVILGAAQGRVWFFDPAGRGQPEEIGFRDLDTYRVPASFETLLVSAPGA